MTKYEWERELKARLSALPSSELNKLFEYYNELFEDKIDAGMQEEAVIQEFGNPVDVSKRILEEVEIHPEAAFGENVKKRCADDTASRHYEEYHSERNESFKPIYKDEPRVSEPNNKKTAKTERPVKEQARKESYTVNIDEPKKGVTFGTIVSILFRVAWMAVCIGIVLSIGAVAVTAGGYTIAAFVVLWGNGLCAFSTNIWLELGLVLLTFAAIVLALWIFWGSIKYTIRRIKKTVRGIRRITE